MASKILLADDSITIQKVVNLTFADEGIDVITVSNGEMAERRLSEINPDLVLADIFMPGKNGYELCQFIKDTPPFQNIPVVLLVGAFEPFDQSEARRVRADGHLTKPFESRTLVETVRKLIQTSRSRSGSAKQTAAKQPASIRETRPLAPEPEQRQDDFIDISQIVTDSSPMAVPQNGAPAAGFAQDGQATMTGTAADPIGVDYHGIWEIGSGSDPGVESHSSVPGDLSFGIDLGQGDAAQSAEQGPPITSGFEISTPQDSQPATGAFEFGFAEPSAEVRTQESQVTQGAEAERVLIPSTPASAAPEQVAGFAVPSLFSNSAPDQVLDFKQVDAPEPPPPANEVSFELSSVPGESSAPALETAAKPGSDDKYFDLIPQQGPATTAKPEVIQASEQPEMPSRETAGAAGTGFDLAGPAETAGAGESGFDLTGLTETPLGSNATSERGPVEEEPLGDVFSPDQPASPPYHETSFAIAEEAVTVDVRPPASESFRMVLPRSQEGEYGGVWPHLDSDQSASSQVSKTDSESFGGKSTSGSDTLFETDSSSHVPERSFAISETGAAEKPFDPMELRADEPTEAPPVAQIQNDFRPEPAAAEPFTSSLMWSEHPQSPAQSADSVAVDEPLGHVLATVAEESQTGSVNDWAAATQSGFDVAGNGVLEGPPGPSSGAEKAERHFATGDPAIIENQPDAAFPPSSVNLPPAAIDEIVRRVVCEMSDAVVRELAWEILPDCVERVVEKLSRESLLKKL